MQKKSKINDFGVFSCKKNEISGGLPLRAYQASCVPIHDIYHNIYHGIYHGKYIVLNMVYKMVYKIYHFVGVIHKKLYRNLGDMTCPFVRT